MLEWLGDVFKVVVCASGGGGNFRAIAAGARTKDSSYVVTRLIVDRECPARRVAEEFNIPAVTLEFRSRSGDPVDLLPEVPVGTDLVVLAGFMSIVSKQTTSKLEGRIINTHPSLLPKHGGVGMFGVNVHRAVLDSGDKWTGCTVHYVNQFIDEGPVIAQRRIRVIRGETAWGLGSRVFDLEGPLLVEIIRQFSLRKA